jgi:glycosyltransferase involved in cell wall biosynthesis
MVGSIVRPNNSGLGTLALEFVEHGLIDKCLLFPNGVYKDFPDRFPNSRMCKSHLSIQQDEIDWLLSDIKTLLILETPFNWSIIKQAKEKGIKVVFVPMHECLPEPVYMPDVWVCVSDLDFELPYIPKIRLNIPVNTDKISWKVRGFAKTFIHNAGHGGLQGRNGTKELVEAMKYVKSPIKLIIRSQSSKTDIDDNRIEFIYGNYENYQDLYRDGDVFVFPEKFNGLSLPLQEAFASGMGIITTDKSCFSWLPKDLLLPVKWEKTRVAREVDSAIHDPIEIAKKIDFIYNKDISTYSREGRKWSEENNWKSLREHWKSVLS